MCVCRRPSHSKNSAYIIAKHASPFLIMNPEPTRIVFVLSFPLIRSCGPDHHPSASYHELFRRSTLYADWVAWQNRNNLDIFKGMVLRRPWGFPVTASKRWDLSTAIAAAHLGDGFHSRPGVAGHFARMGCDTEFARRLPRHHFRCPFSALQVLRRTQTRTYKPA